MVKGKTRRTRVKRVIIKNKTSKTRIKEKKTKSKRLVLTPKAITEKLKRDILSVKIQGAENIALESVKTLKEVIKHSREKTINGLMMEVLNFFNEVSGVRPTEPCLHNSFNFIKQKMLTTADQEDPAEFVSNILNYCDEVLSHFERSKQVINNLVFRKIPNGSIVFTHCHSSTVVDALIYSFKKGKDFVVYNTETRPLFQGRITASELSHAGIRVYHFVDSAARIALKKADIMLIGADVITSEGKIINKVGSELFAETAHNFDVPVYSCTDSWKFDVNSIFAFDVEIEKRFEKEVWPEKPKGVIINNYAFEKVNQENITGVISELGIFRPTVFIEEFKHNYPFLLKKID